MPNIMTSVDDPNDPAPELELLEEWDRVFPPSSSSAGVSKSKNATYYDAIPFSKEDFLAGLGIESLPDEPMEHGLPVPEYMKRYKAAMDAEDWQAIADLWHTKLDYSLIKALERLKYNHELYS